MMGLKAVVRSRTAAFMFLTAIATPAPDSPEAK